MKKITKYFAVLGLCAFVLPAAAEDEALAVSIKRLTMESALKVAQAGIEACRKKGIQIGITVVDRGGHPQVVLRDVLAPDLTLTVSHYKAYTAVSFTAATSALTDRFKDNPFSPGKAPKITTSAGGLPIEAGGVLYGGVGVSGAPDGKVDEECAQAGIDAIQGDLEMAGF